MTQTQQPEALRLADKYEVDGFLQDHRFAKDHWCRQAAAELRRQQARIEELEAQLEAIGAGGVEPLRKCNKLHQVAEPASPVVKPIKDAIDALVMAAFTEGGCSEHRMSEARIQTELRKKELRAALAATQPAEQGLELANCKCGKWLTVVYRDIQPGDESRTIGEHPKVSALSWSHALNDRDAALAAQAKQGERS